MSKKGSPASSPSSSLQDCDPQKNVLLKRNGWRGVIVAVVVVSAALIIILVSKWNDVRSHRIPFVWRNRLRGLVKEATDSLKLAQEAATPGTAYRHALQANTTLLNAKKLVGPGDLSKLSGYDSAKLESEIEVLLRRSVPSSLLLREEASEQVPNMKPRQVNIARGPKSDLQSEKKETLRDVAEKYKIQIEAESSKK